MKSVAPAIRQRGFRKWYERELLAGHSHLVLLLLCTVALDRATPPPSSPSPDARH